MPQYYDSIPDNLKEWIIKQPLFFTGTAPTTGKHINVSPKGLPNASFAILNAKQVAYIDSTGSGSETISHLYENGRITIMFCSFDKSPRILRLFCTGHVIERDSGLYNDLVEKMGEGKEGGVGLISARAVILMDVWKVQTSCGYGVPIATPEGFTDRDTLVNWGTKTVEKGELGEYQIKWNVRSLDGCTGLKFARRRAGETMVIGDVRAWLHKVIGSWDAVLFGAFLGVALMMIAWYLANIGVDITKMKFTSDW